MNANELADELQKMFVGEEYDRLVHEIPDLLRQQQAEINTLRNHGYKTQYELLRIEFLQQQAEIEALKKEAALQRLSDFTQEAESFDRTASHMAGEYVSYKAELTDEEIRHIQAQCHLKDVGYDGFIMRFARAILKKALK